MKRSAALLAVFSSSAEWESAHSLIRSGGLGHPEAISPFPVATLFPTRSRNPFGIPVLAAGLSGSALAFSVQWWACSHPFPLNIGGRPILSWPNFVPISFVIGVLFAAVTLFLSLFWQTDIPRPHRKLFNSPSYDFSRKRFYLLFLPGDPPFREAELLRLLKSFPSVKIEEVAW